jgi:hypothetical protein|tara:strand:+ start:668 stop:964 length:297 start_codon:yes stop_codon:yes gene_type:complete
MSDPINPNHYKKEIETWDAILSQLTDEEKIGYLRGSAMKYLCRFGCKNKQTISQASEDCSKSVKYLEKLMALLAYFENQGKSLFNYDATNVTNLKNKK